MSETDYSSWQKAELLAEFLRRGLDGPFMSDLPINSRTRKDDLVGELLYDDFLCAPCNCPIHRGERDFMAGRWDTPAARYYIDHLRERSAPGVGTSGDRISRVERALRHRDRADALHSQARRAMPGSPRHRWLFEREQWWRERERRARLR